MTAFSIASRTHNLPDRLRRTRRRKRCHDSTKVVSPLVMWTAMILALYLSSDSSAFTLTENLLLKNDGRRHQQQLTAAASKGFGGGSGGSGSGSGFATSSSSSKKKKLTKKTTTAARKPSPQALKQHLEQKYGGTSPQDIARGTQVLIDQAMGRLPQHIQLALQLYKQQIEWNRRISGMDVLAQSQLPLQLVDQARRAQDTLDQLLQEHSLSMLDLHVLLQQITWDASADAKAVKSLTGIMPKDIQHRVQRACEYVANVTKTSTNDKVLDVGCGYGVLVPYLKQAGIVASQIHGMDLSSEMIKNAQSFYPDVHFEVANFLQKWQLPPLQNVVASKNGSVSLSSSVSSSSLYSAVIFCSSLHDLPDMKQALWQAKRILNKNAKSRSRIVIVHPQGASHVWQQHQANPVLVPRGLPTAIELHNWLCDGGEDFSRMELTVAPAEPKSEQEIREGYLAVLTMLC